MKRSLLTTLAISSLSVAAYAQSSATITLSGSVPSKITISINNPTYSLNMGSGAGAQTVGTATETSNDPKGYTVYLESLNAATNNGVAILVGAISQNTDTVPYTIKYNGTGVSLNSSGKSTVPVTDATAKTDSGGVTKDIQVTLTPPTNLGADSYSDTLKLTIAGK